MKIFLILLLIILQTKSYWVLASHSKIKNNMAESQTVVFQLYGSGLGSNLIHLLAFKNYVENKKSDKSTFIVDETHYSYKYRNQGVMTAFFEPTVPILKNEDEFNNFVQSKGKEGLALIWTRSARGANRSMIRSAYPWKGASYYEWMSKEACSTLRFSKIGLQRINELKTKNDIPSFANSISVGFHVRRGDKTLREAKKKEGEDYVNLLLSITAETDKSVENCFIASDDIQGLIDIKKALKKSKVPCKVYSLVNRSQKGNKEGVIRSDAEILQFITELSILIDVTYFIGDFASNVASLLSMMRSCGKIDKSHYSQSHTVGRQGYVWFK